MDSSHLQELVGIWEYWTNGDPLLRYAFQGRCPDSATCRDLLDRTRERLIWVSHDRTGTATAIGLNAGWAVLLALEHANSARSPLWHRLCNDTLRAHQDACAARPHAT
jgi:hypothetical protein